MARSKVVERATKKLAEQLRFGDDDEASDALSVIMNARNGPSVNRYPSPETDERLRILEQIAERNRQRDAGNFIEVGEIDESYAVYPEDDSSELPEEEDSRIVRDHDPESGFNFEITPEEVDEGQIRYAFSRPPELGGFADLCADKHLVQASINEVTRLLDAGAPNDWRTYELAGRRVRGRCPDLQEKFTELERSQVIQEMAEMRRHGWKEE